MNGEFENTMPLTNTTNDHSIFDNNLTLRKYEFKTDKLSGKVKLLLLSDLHGCKHENLPALIIDENPDAILMAGDMFDFIAPLKNTEEFLKKIQGLCPMYYVTGNHEYKSRKINEIRFLLKNCGIDILSDFYKEIHVRESHFILAGVEDTSKKKSEDGSYSQEASMEKSFSALLNSKKYKILLAHRPERIDLYRRFGFDLVLAGHTHGGQVRIPNLIPGLFATGQGLFPKYVGGLYTLGDVDMIVSRGLSVNILRPRIFNPPELISIYISGTENESFSDN